MTNPNKEWADRADSLANDPERIKHRQETLTPAFTVPRNRKKFSAALTINAGKEPLDIRFESDTLEDLKHQIGQVQFLSFDGEIEARQKQWRIDNGIKAPKKPMQAARESVSTEEHRTAAKDLPPSFKY